MPYNVFMPPRTHSENTSITYKWSGGRNRPGKVIKCASCKVDRWIPLENILRSKMCFNCRTIDNILCAHCGKKFHPNNRKVHYCSKACVNQARAGKQLVKPDSVICPKCGKSFLTLRRRPHRFCSSQCWNEFNKKEGPDNPLYIDGRSKQNKDYERLSLSTWRKLSTQIRKRDDHRCFICHALEKKLHVHHIRPYHSGGSDSQENLVTLCQSCHKKIKRNMKMRSFLKSEVKRLYYSTK